MSTEELRKAVDALGKVLAFAGSENQADWQTILAALRDQEAEIARLREERDSQQRSAIAALDRAEMAGALLREAASFLSIHHPVGPNTIARITAHLGGENNG